MKGQSTNLMLRFSFFHKPWLTIALQKYASAVESLLYTDIIAIYEESIQQTNQNKMSYRIAPIQHLDYSVRYVCLQFEKYSR
jgi:hypothetical protein